MKKRVIVLTILGAIIISGLTVIGGFAAVDVIPTDEAARLSAATQQYDYNTWMRPDVKAIIEAER